MKYKIYNEDVIEWAKSYDKIKFHALLCDSPYHLQSIVKRFGKKNSTPAKHGIDGVFQRASSGFMGQEWDGGDIAFNPETWALLGEHLHDGAFGMAYAASRNWHRVAVAIEDAGFIIHPSIFCWVQGQGFPKATNISKQIEKGKKVGTKKTNVGIKGNRFASNSQIGEVDIIEFQSELAQAWSGHRYGLQALKPAVEPIIVFQKPYDGKPLDNITQTGAGALNIDGARIPLLTEDDEYVINTFDDGAKPWGDAKGEKYTSRNEQEGRWPANFVVDDETAKRLDEQSGIRTSGKLVGTYKGGGTKGIYGEYQFANKNYTANTGGASRFFYNVLSLLDESDPIMYCPKVSSSEKIAGLDNRCNHPTMKPISLNQWLATLLLPPNMYAPRNLLVPFSGVGSEMIGGVLAGWDRILGIEKDTENGYVDIAYKRLEYWSNENSN